MNHKSSRLSTSKVLRVKPVYHRHSTLSMSLVLRVRTVLITVKIVEEKRQKELTVGPFQSSLSLMTIKKLVTIQQFAAQNDCAIIRDGEGYMSLLARRYTDDGLKITRHRPDPCSFWAEAEWMTVIEMGVGEKWICT